MFGAPCFGLRFRNLQMRVDELAVALSQRSATTGTLVLDPCKLVPEQG